MAVSDMDHVRVCDMHSGELQHMTVDEFKSGLIPEQARRAMLVLPTGFCFEWSCEWTGRQFIAALIRYH